MQEDIYSIEQRILDEAKEKLTQVKTGDVCSVEEYSFMVNEYSKILRQLRRVTKIADRITNELHGDNLELTDKAHQDPLTGIYNRRYMEENLKRIKKSLTRTNGQLSILMLDVDYFKPYNDTYGHAKGDICLVLIATTIAECLLRPDDFVARFGGEEFIVVLPNTDKVGALHIAEKIKDAVAQLDIPHEKSTVATHVTVSIGVATGAVKRDDKMIDYIKCADTALYDAKNSGRNRYVHTCFNEEQT